MRGYIPPSNDEERLLVHRVEELANTVRQRGLTRTTSFLNDRQQVLAQAALSAIDFNEYSWEGGYPDAERKILTLCGEYGKTAWPAQCLMIETPHAAHALTHRDYLGALMSLGIKRECIGDILPAQEGAFLFVLNQAARIVQDELFEVGRCAVHVRKADPAELPQQQEGEIHTVTLSSLRLDALLAAMLHISRADAVQMIRSGLVEVNHVASVSAHYEVFENDRFSVRGHGKYKLCKVGTLSRKGRTFVSYIEY